MTKKMTGKYKVIQLLECCDETLCKETHQKRLRNPHKQTHRRRYGCSPQTRCTRGKHDAGPYQTTQHAQDRNETIRSFSARPRGQASLCKFTIICPNCAPEINYANNILRDTLTVGIAESDINLDLLGDKNQNMILEEAFLFIEAKEAGRLSATHLLNSQSIEATRSQYRRDKQENMTQGVQTNKIGLCSYFGKHSHGRNAPPNIRRQKCPAYGKMCENCERPNHNASMCRSKDKAKRWDAKNNANRDQENAVLDSLCMTNSHQLRNNGILLNHHTYNDLNDRWVKQPSQLQPFLYINAKCHPGTIQPSVTP